MTNRPHVICHMATTVDGKIKADHWPEKLSAHGHYEKCHESFKANAWLVGRTTMEQHFASSKVKKLGKPDRFISKEDFVGDHSASRFAVVIDAAGKCRWDSNSITGDHVVEVLSEEVSIAYLRHLREKNVSYIFAGKSDVDLAIALKKLRKLFGIQ